MIVPAVITLGVLGLLAVSREGESSAHDLDREMDRYGQLIAQNRLDEIDPAKLDALAKELERQGRLSEMTIVNAWALHVRSVKRGVQSPMPPGLPASNVPSPGSPPQGTPASTLPAELQTRVSVLLAQGEAAAPAELDTLAQIVEQVSPDNFAATALRALAAQNRALMQQPPVQGAPTARYLAPNRVAVPSADRAPSVGHAPVQFQQRFRMSVPSLKCNHQGGCVLFRTPGHLYPSSVVVPFNARVAVLNEQGAWFETVYGGQRGWLPKNEFVAA